MRIIRGCRWTSRVVVNSGAGCRVYHLKGPTVVWDGAVALGQGTRATCEAKKAGRSSGAST